MHFNTKLENQLDQLHDRSIKLVKKYLQMTNDDLSVVLVKRKAMGVASDASALQENMHYDGNLNPLTFQRHYDLNLRCGFDFEFFPFDHQLCSIEVS